MTGLTPTVIYLNRCAAFATKAKTGPGPFHRGEKMDRSPPSRHPDLDPDNYRLAWAKALGSRLRIDDRRGLMLDGRPVGLDQVMIETNRIRKSQGLLPVGKKPSWQV